MAQRSLTLLLDDIAGSQSDEVTWPKMPALQRLLSKGRRERLDEGLEECLLGHFPLSPERSPEPPLAALSAKGDGLEAGSGWWLRADPVHLVADRDQLYLSAYNTLGLEMEEASALVGELNRLYGGEGWQFIAVTPQRWYLRLPAPLAMRTVPTAEAMGCRVGEVLPQGEDALDWQRVMTEIQMLLHASPVNAQRSERGLPAVNSLWFWGGGTLPAAAGGAGWSRVVADEPLARGLAAIYGIEAEGQGSRLPEADGASDTELWQLSLRSLQRAEEELFVPLLGRLLDGELQELLIEVPAVARWRIDRRALRRWWRRRRPLSTLLERGR